MKRFLLIMVLFTFTLAHALAQGNWYMKKNFGGVARYAPFSFSIGTKGYIGGGLGTAGAVSDMWEWDQASNTWTQKASYPIGGPAGPVQFVIGTKAYVATGYDGTADVKTMYEWDQPTNTWTKKADYNLAAEQGFGFSIGSKGYTGGGLVSSVASKEFWEYDPSTNAWTQKADLMGGSARYSGVAFNIGSYGYAALGNDGTNYMSDLWEYDTGTNVWTAKSKCPGSGRTAAGGFVIGNKAYMGNGRDGTYQYIDWYEWDQLSDTWTRMTNFFLPRYWAASFSIGNLGYFGTGQFTDGSTYVTQDFWEFNPLAPGFTVHPTDTMMCAGPSLVLTVQGYGGAVQYKWQKDEVDISNWSTDTFLVIDPTTGADNGFYRCIIKNAYGYDTSYEAEVNISAGTPDIVADPEETYVCYGRPATLNIEVESNSPVTYQWYKGGKPITGATDSFYTKSSIKEADTGYYYCLVTNICGSDTSDSAMVSYTPIPAKPTITQNKSILTCSPAAAYQWKKYNTNMPGETNQTLFIKETAKYSCEITDIYGCKRVSDEALYKPSAIEDVNGEKLISIFPNPNDGSFTLKLNITEPVTIKVVNSLGEVFFEELLNNAYNTEKLINLDKPAPGVYYVQISGKETNRIERVFIQK